MHAHAWQPPHRRSHEYSAFLPHLLFFLFFPILFLKKASSSSACKHRCAGNHKLHLRSTLPRVLNMERVAGRCKLRAVWGDAVKFAHCTRERNIFPPTQIKTLVEGAFRRLTCAPVSATAIKPSVIPVFVMMGRASRFFRYHCHSRDIVFLFSFPSFSVIKILWFYQV